ncbi:hypothetical protein XENTR_v10013447 [Xenopus tropicalis]|nr:hypothetical protein XENTR_v10013447 [Xenopus tropicalis]
MLQKMAEAEERLETLQIYKVLQCVLNQDKEQLEKLISLGIKDLINSTEPRNGDGALHLAAAANNVDMCVFLLSLGAQPNIQDLNGCTPAMKATEHGHDLVLEVLAKAGADMSIVNNKGKGILFYCISATKRHLRCLQIALDYGADVNNCTTEGMPILFGACEQAQDCKAMCLKLLDKGANPNSSNPKTGRTALMEAAREGALEVVRSILEKGGDVNAIDNERNHAVHFAAKGGFFEVLKVLSAYKADMGIIAMDGNTALHHAASGGFSECCRFLGQRGCNPLWKNVKTMTPKDLAKEGGFKAAVKEIGKVTRLFKKYSKPTAQNPNPLWALTLHDWASVHEAVLREKFQLLDKGDGTVGKEEFASALLEAGAPITPEQLQNILGRHEKGRTGTLSVEEFLKGSKYLQKAFLLSSYGLKKKKGKKKGKKGKKGKLSLPMPICTMPSDFISRRDDGGPPKFLIPTFQNVTDLNRFDWDHPPQNPLTDDTGWYIDEPEKVYTHISVATKTGDMESLRKAFEDGVPLDVKDMFYKTPLMSACASGNLNVVQYLLEQGADVNATDNFLWTPLHHACHASQDAIADLLLKHGAKIDALAFNGSTPLMRAIESGSLNCAHLLINSGAKVQIQNKKGQTVLDVAKAYADYRLIDMIQAKLDSLPKPKEKKGKTKGNMEGKAKGPKTQTPGPSDPAHIKQELIQTKLAVPSKEKKSGIIHLNSMITAGETKRVDITFVPKSVWIAEPTTAERMKKREVRRQIFSYDVDFDNFQMPFTKNLTEKPLTAVPSV